MQSLLFLVLLVTTVAQLCAGQQRSHPRHATEQPGLDARVRGLEERLQNQQFEINQLKKELLARDEELHALTQMIEGDPNADQNPDQQDDDTFEVETDACQQTRFVQFSRPDYRSGRAKRISLTLN